MKTIAKFKNIFSFETARLIAKRIDANDLDKLIALHTDPSVAATLSVFTVDQVRDKHAQYIEHWRQHGFGLWVFYLKGTDEWVGRGGLNQKKSMVKKL